MKIRRFECRSLNGYLNFDLKFKEKVSFLVGINGSGKTSVLKASMALLAPDVDWLMNAKFEYIAIHLSQIERDIVIECKNNGKSLEISFIETIKKDLLK